jgi:hypothetical protein
LFADGRRLIVDEVSGLQRPFGLSKPLGFGRNQLRDLRFRGQDEQSTPDNQALCFHRSCEAGPPGVTKV